MQMRILVAIAFLALSASVVFADVYDGESYARYTGKTITRIEVTGNRVTKEYVIRREIAWEEGNAFDPADGEETIRALSNLGIFSSVQIGIVEDGGGVAIDVHVRELPWIIPYLKAKYNEQNGWSVGPTVSSVNMLGRDIYLTGFVLFGGSTAFSLQFSYPWITKNHLSLDLLAEHVTRENVFYDFEESVDEITPWVGTFIGKNGRLRGAVSYFGMKSDKPDRTLEADNRDDLIRIGAGGGYDSRDSWQNPHNGWYIDSELMKTGGFLGGDGDFLTTTVDARRYQPWGDRNTFVLGGLTTLQRGTVGVDLPVYMQYNIGGANTVRGHDVDLGKKLYGKNQMIFTVEYQYMLMNIKEYEIIKWPVTFGLEGALFVDSGAAWSDRDEFGTKRFKSGFGFGLRALIPAVDVARFDFGFNLNGDFEFHFGLWSKFDAQRLLVR